MCLAYYSERRADAGARAEAQRGLEMFDRDVRLARPTSEGATDVPAAGLVRVEREGSIDQRHHGTDVLAEIGKCDGGIRQNPWIITSHFKGPSREADAFPTIHLPVFTPTVLKQPKTAECTPGECGPITRIARDRLLHKTERLRVPQLRRHANRIGAQVEVVSGQIGDDGVNIAARLEGIAEPGGICISEGAFRQVRGKVDAGFTDIGEQRLKNIARPIRAYRMAREQSRETQVLALPLPDKPSIAVLPFANMSGDPEQEYFADGMVEEIITALSRIRWLFVIARNSSFTYKGQAVDVTRVGHELGVRYVLEGPVRKAAGRVRITAQLINALTGTHLWADRFDGLLEDVFELQDKVSSSVAGVIEPALQAAETARSAGRRAENVVTLHQDIAEMDADAPFHAAVIGNPCIALRRQPLQCQAAFDGPDDRAELDQHPVTGRLNNAAAMPGDERIGGSVMFAQRSRRPLLVLAHQSRIARDIGGKDRGETAGSGHG